jgi:predicted phosphodiesterase
MRIAVIADIHGNLPALEAVLADIQRRGVDRTINLGDSVSGPLWPREVCDLLMASSSLVIRGNHDRWVSGPDPASMGPSDRYAHSNLGADHRHWLGALPTSADAGNGIFACHGTPTDDNQYLIEEVSEHHLVRAHRSTIRERLGDVQARVVLCGHSHQQHLIQLPDGPLILNPGSVGCPSYDDPGAEPHVSEGGSPHARYAVLTIIGEHVSAELGAISYDWKAAAARATPMGEQNGPTVYEQGGSWPIPAGGTSPPPLEPKGTADVRSICVVSWRAE